MQEQMQQMIEKLKRCLLPEPAETVTAAVLIPIILPPEGEPFLYLQVRSASVKQPGEISFPGGHTEIGETPSQTALRETEEEFGLPGDAFEILGCLPLHHRRDRSYTVQAVVGLARAEELPEVRANEEVGEVFRLPLRFLLETPVRRYIYDPKDHDPETYPPILYGYLTRYDEHIIETHYWEYEEKGIWGLTARLLNRFVGMIRQDENTK